MIEINTVQEKMEKAIESLKYELNKVRTGRANPSMLDGIMVAAYGNPTPINQLALISVPEARQLLIKPFDPSLIGEVEKGILNGDLGINPVNDGETLRLTIPALTEEIRAKYSKEVKATGEELKVRVRSIRQDANNTIKKSDDLTDDEKKGLENDVQELTNKFNKQIDEIVKNKEQEVMTI